MVGSRHDSARNTFPVFEALEPRRLLAGCVWATAMRGDLYIIGDQSDNGIVVDQVGLSQNEFRISSGATGVPTAINGSLGPKVVSGVAHNIWVWMWDGTDDVQFHDANVTGNLHLYGGGEASVLNVGGVAVTGSLIAVPGPIQNEMVVDGCSVRGDVRFSGGNPASSFAIDGLGLVAISCGWPERRSVD